ncbi:ATP-binding cassette domain-containing protein [Bacillus sp. JCM 19034]|uniref:ABC transporter ATP-binding protein n=1 Tax=Bacillus sp. JCM 19034 TaxID=1481928 RepID=UPI000780956B|nr:ATP-binding cassette domain-containing protein [Bacillus sp. JCM 19034]
MVPIIVVDDFVKKYGNFTAVDHVSFEVESGTIFAFLGPNGAGKSTTINTLCTIVDKNAGTLLIDGKDVSEQKEEVRKMIGVVFQDSTLDAKMTVEENLMMHGHFYNMSRTLMKERITFVLELVEMLPWKKAMIQQLSGGMKRRVEIARSLLHLPKVLFLDEPTTGLDPQTRANIWEYLIKLQREHQMTIFLTTHYMDEAEISDQVAIMDHGKIVALDTPQRLKQLYTKDRAAIVSDDPVKFAAVLTDEGFRYEKNRNTFNIEVEHSSQLIRFLTKYQPLISDIEIKKGTLNDVFLTITGKEMRG